MRECVIVFKKEIKNFLIRKAMVKWYLMICGMNLIFVLAPGWDFIPFTKNKPLFAFTMMLFSVFLVPNTLSLDIVGGEKYHRTLETIISTPISIRKLLFGKILFVLLLGFVSLVSITIMDNIVMFFLYQNSFLGMGLEIQEMAIMYSIVLVAILLIVLLGSVLTLVISNLKLSGYLLTIINIAIIFLVFYDFRKMNYNRLWKDFAILVGALLVISVFVIIKLSKQRVMKYIK